MGMGLDSVSIPAFDQGVHDQIHKRKHTLQLVHQGLARTTEKDEMKS